MREQIMSLSAIVAGLVAAMDSIAWMYKSMVTRFTWRDTYFRDEFLLEHFGQKYKYLFREIRKYGKKLEKRMTFKGERITRKQSPYKRYATLCMSIMVTDYAETTVYRMVVVGSFKGEPIEVEECIFRRTGSEFWKKYVSILKRKRPNINIE